MTSIPQYLPLLDVTLATLACPLCATWTETSQCLQGSTRSDVLGFYKISLQIQWHLTCWIPRGHSFLPRTDQGVAVHEVLLCFCLNCFIYFFHRSFYPTDQSKSAEMLTSLLKVCYRGRQLFKLLFILPHFPPCYYVDLLELRHNKLQCLGWRHCHGEGKI